MLSNMKRDYRALLRPAMKQLPSWAQVWELIWRPTLAGTMAYLGLLASQLT